MEHGTGGASRTDPEGFTKIWWTGNDTRDSKKRRCDEACKNIPMKETTIHGLQNTKKAR